MNEPNLRVLLEGAAGPIAAYLVKRGLQVEKRAKQLCPVDTGRLRGSITSALMQGQDTIKVVIGTDVEYASFVEFGTSRMVAQPFLLPALASIMGTTS